MRDTRYDKIGLTLVEMVVALAIITVVFAVIVPQFRMILDSWDSRAGAAEAIQNGRVLVDHLNRNLSKAVIITDVSDSNDPNGFIEFEDNDGNTLRYDIASDYVEFGVLGGLSDLAGPVSKLQFTCYDDDDLDAPLDPITDVNVIRFVKVETTLTNSAARGQNKTFIAKAYLRANGSTQGSAEGLTKETPFECDPNKGRTPALAQIDSTHYLCAYEGEDGDGFASVLTVNTGNWTISSGEAVEFDTSNAELPVLAQIDSTHYLCVYEGKGNDGFAVVLTVDTGWTVSLEGRTPFEFEIKSGMEPALAKIDDTHYLCAYRGPNDDGWAVILSVDTGNWTIAKGGTLEFEPIIAKEPALAKIDDSHYLCTYRDELVDHGWAVVLTVDTVGWTISLEGRTPFKFNADEMKVPALAQIDSTHYLCVHKGLDDDGWSVVLIVDAGDWTISTGTPFEFESVYGNDLALIKIDTDDYLCAYRNGDIDIDPNIPGKAVILTVDTGNWTISGGTAIEYESSYADDQALAGIDSSHYLCAYEGPDQDGWAVVLSVGSGSGIRP